MQLVISLILFITITFPSVPCIGFFLQAAWVNIHGRPLLVLATTKGVLIYDWDGSVLRHAHLLPTPPPDSPFSFMKGITALSIGYICVGKALLMCCF